MTAYRYSSVMQRLLHALMKKYHDRPMDFADAALVQLAHCEGLQSILTVDCDDFETYRIDGRKRFQIFPSRLQDPAFHSG